MKVKMWLTASTGHPSNNGKKMYASDFLWNFLIWDRYRDKKYFDFGISTEENGLYLNKDLIKYKEEFNARAITHDFYEMNISNWKNVHNDNIHRKFKDIILNPKQVNWIKKFKEFYK